MMHLSHPSAPFQGIPKEDVFFAAGDNMIQMGYGYVIVTMQPELYPERPMQIYLHISAQPSARSLLLGALLGRAEQIRAYYPGIKGRIYAHLPAGQSDMLNFYLHSGFTYDDAEEEYIFTLPEGNLPSPPMGCQFASVPLQTPDEFALFLSRINHYRMTPIGMDYLTVQAQQPHFMALGFYRGGQPVAELFTTGAQNGIAGLVSMYVRQDCRRQGMAKALLLSCAALLRERGVTQCMAQIYSRNLPQKGLMRSLSAVRRRMDAILPGIDIG